VNVGLHDYRQFACAISERHLIHQEINTIYDKQAGHSSATRSKHYAVNRTDFLSLDKDQLYCFKKASLQWHALLGLSVSPQITQIQTAPIDTVPVNTPSVIQIAIPSLVPSEDFSITLPLMHSRSPPDRTSISDTISARILVALQRFFNDDTARFKSPHQATSIQRIIEARTNLLIVSATGSGKSVIVLIPSLLQDGTSVLILPFRAIVDQFEKICQNHGVSYVSWSNAWSNGADFNIRNPPKLFLVSIEVAVSTQFRSFLNLLVSAKQLRTIFFDEAHTLIYHAEFRPVMLKFCELRSIAALNVFLTATLPPEDEVNFQIATGLSISILRSETIRPNLRYSVIDTANIDDVILQQLHRYMITRKSHERCILFCLEIKEVQRLCDLINARLGQGAVATMFHSQSERMAYLDWINGQQHIIVCTSAFGAGVDYSAASLILHQGLSNSLVDYAQETGRGGRDGGVCDCITITNTQFMKHYLNRRSTVSAGLLGRSDAFRTQEMIDLLKDKDKCRRQTLHRALDGQSNNCLAYSNCELCDNCQKSYSQLATAEATSLTVAPSRSWIQSAADVAILDECNQSAFVRGMKQLLNDFDGFCVLCCANFEVSEKRKHDYAKCPRIARLCVICLSSNHWARSCTNRVQLPSGICFQCGLMNQVGTCDIHPENFGQCSVRNKDKIFPICWWAWRSTVRASLLNHFSCSFSDDVAYAEWLGQQRQAKITNACRVFMWYFDTCHKQ
jgi:superfamily II DNA helicase RecQ